MRKFILSVVRSSDTRGSTQDTSQHVQRGTLRTYVATFHHKINRCVQVSKQYNYACALDNE